LKKIMYISGIIAVLLLAFLLTGAASADDTVKKALRQGNRQYESGLYRYAMQTYETGLSANPEHKVLNFNAAQAAYLLGEYAKAIEYYAKSEDFAEKYLNAGNIFFRAGDLAEDEDPKLQLYIEAMQIYLEGIIKFPQDVPLKYNYEILKEKVEELLENMEHESDGSGEGDGEIGDDEEAQEMQEYEEQDSEENQNAGEENEENEDGQEESYSRDDEEDTLYLDQEAIERILQMLENQEAENLKNNREIVSGGDTGNGW